MSSCGLILRIVLDSQRGGLVLFEVVDVRVAEHLRAEDVNQAVSGRRDFLFDLTSVLRHDTHGLWITQLSNKAILLLRYLNQRKNCRISQEYVFGEWETLHQLHDSVGILKVPKQEKQEERTGQGWPAEDRLKRNDLVDFIVEAFIRLQIYCGTHSYLRIDHVGYEALDVLEAAVDEALLVVDQIEEKNVKASG